jgi:4-hydroxy-tetrahydrodipicolinate synthase
VSASIAATRPGGIVCPLVTPLGDDGRLDEAVLRDLIDALVPDLDGLFVLGSSGELTWLPDDVGLAVARTAIEAAAGRLPVYVGVGDTGLRRTLDRVDRMADTGADFLVVAAPFYYAVDSEAGLIDHYATIADRATAPVVLYNIPQNTHRPLTPAVVATLAAHPNIVGIKDSAGDWFAFAEFLRLRGDGFSVLQGRERLAAISLWSGADGLISAMANVAPRLLGELTRAVADERPRPVVHALQSCVDELAGIFDQADWLAGLKASLQALGWAVGDPSRPIAPYTGPQRAAVATILSSPELAGRLTAGPGR